MYGFLRSKDIRGHPGFAAKFNDVHVTKKDRLTISLRENSPLTFSVHFLKNKIAWIDPEFHDLQLTESTKDKKTETNSNSAANLKTPKTSLLVDTTDQAIEINCQAQTNKSRPKPTVADNLELNDMKAKLKSTAAQIIQLKKKRSGNSMEYSSNK